jgi:hypothetical protein
MTLKFRLHWFSLAPAPILYVRDAGASFRLACCASPNA